MFASRIQVLGHAQWDMFEEFDCVHGCFVELYFVTIACLSLMNQFV